MSKRTYRALRGRQHVGVVSDLPDNHIYGGFHSSTNLGFSIAIWNTGNVTQKRNGANLLYRILKIDGKEVASAADAD